MMTFSVIATLQENPIQLEKVARGFGWSLDDEGVTVMYRSPNDVYVDQWVYDLLDLVDRTGAKRVMIDSLSDLQYAARDPVRFREFIYSLTQRLSRAGTSLLRTVTILKSRASAHDPDVREFEITPDGIVLGDPIAGDQM